MSNTKQATSLDITLRTLCAVFGGYLGASLVGLFLSYALRVPRDDGIMYGSVISFLVMLLIVIWVFSVKRWQKACLGVAGFCALFAILAWLAKLLELNA